MKGMSRLNNIQRKSIFAMIQLFKIVDELNAGEKGTYAICANNAEDRLHFSMDDWGCKQTPILLKDRDTAMYCLEKHRDLWIDYLMLKQ